MFIQLDDNVTEFGDLVSVELFGQLRDNINHLIDAMPVGSIIPILVGIPGVPTPDPNIWQECDGTTITHPLSPIRNTVAPDYKTLGRYMRMYSNAGEIGNLSGSNTKNLTHSHGGQTDTNPGIPQNADTDNDFWTAKDHTHSIQSGLGIYNFEPIHIRVKHYIKINIGHTSYSSRYSDLEKDFGTSIAQALGNKDKDNINALNKSYPVGVLLYMINSQDNLPTTPDLNFWQLCDGSVVSNPNSPLDGQTLPDFRNKFIRHTRASETDLTQGGQDTVNLAHNHGGQTGITNDRNDFQLDNGGEMMEGEDHSHSISTSLGVTSTVPAHLEMQIYVRIV
jgi:hypothetical protein